MCSPKLLCLPPIANTLRDLDMRFTWVGTSMTSVAEDEPQQMHNLTRAFTVCTIVLMDVSGRVARKPDLHV